jgi:hypothetical protein
LIVIDFVASSRRWQRGDPGRNLGNKIQENTKKRTRLHKGDEEKKPAAKKSNYFNLVEKNRATGKDGFAPLLLRAPNSQSGRQIFRNFF